MDAISTLIITFLGGAGGGAIISALMNYFKEHRLERHRSRLHEKIQCYKEAFDYFAEFVATFQFLENPDLPAAERASYAHDNERRRVQVYCRLAVVAPQEVLSAFDALYEYLADELEGKFGRERTAQKREESRPLREKGLELLNAARRDLGLSSGEMKYRGHR